MSFYYSGEFILRSAYGEVYARGTITEELGDRFAVDRLGIPVRELLSWHGSARVQGAPRGLKDVLGEECRVILSDGRVGKAFVTAYNEESAWVIEIKGAGPVPSLQSSQGSRS